MIYSALSGPVLYVPLTPLDRLRAAARGTLVSVAVALVGLGLPWVSGAFGVM